jgi:hypothetical protein
VIKGISISHQQVIKDLRDMNEKMAYQHAKIEEMEGLIPGYVKQKVGQEMKYHLQELDIRKVETTLFDNVISTKIDKNAFIDLKKEVF